MFVTSTAILWWSSWRCLRLFTTIDIQTFAKQQYILHTHYWFIAFSKIDRRDRFHISCIGATKGMLPSFLWRLYIANWEIVWTNYLKYWIHQISNRFKIFKFTQKLLTLILKLKSFILRSLLLRRHVSWQCPFYFFHISMFISQHRLGVWPCSRVVRKVHGWNN